MTGIGVSVAESVSVLVAEAVGYATVGSIVEDAEGIGSWVKVGAATGAHPTSKIINPIWRNRELFMVCWLDAW
jgi:hypothetical protein